ncbi:MAG: class I SAM-dependent methyltransferase [Candidatus Korobacteraceae bacterium]
MTLREHIQSLIRREGPTPFSRFMELCLYGDPGQGVGGYYTGTGEQFGKAGDFYTSSDVHALFGRLLSRQFQQMWQCLGSPDRLELIELGPGRGLFAQDVLDWSEKKFPEFFAALHYTLVEISPSLRARLEEGFQQRTAANKVSITDRFPTLASASTFIVFANEFLDALPVEVVSTEGQLHIGLREERLAEVFLPTSPKVLEYLDRFSVQPEPEERLEAGSAAMEKFAEIAASLQGKGFLLFIDYGYTREEQLAGRHRGTLKSIRRHSITASPYDNPGEQDITADVNFTAIAAAAQSAGLDMLGLVTQAQFLIGIGEVNQFADAFEECRLPQEHAKVALQLKHLATPAGMGERFHVLVLGKGVSKEQSAELGGLTFSRIEIL